MPRESPEHVVRSMPPKRLDLSVIDDAFGDFADLYSDVLRVSVAATNEQIQMAYFDRRSELFTLLAKMDARPQGDASLQERLETERKMDSVVLAVRILGDPDQRLMYDRMRQERLLNRRRAQHGQLPGHNPRVGASLDAAYESEEEVHHPRSKSSEHRAASSKVVPKHKKKQRKHDEERPHVPTPRRSARVGKQVNARSGKDGNARSGKDAHARVGKEVNARSGNEVNATSGNEVNARSGNEVNARSRKEAGARYGMIAMEAMEPTEHEMSDDEEQGRSVLTRNTSLDTEEMRQDDGDTTIYSVTSQVEATPKSSSYLSCITNSRIVRRISAEISGACEDTLVSVDQVFHAFTLTDKDIKAVTKRIDKAKRQLDG